MKSFDTQILTNIMGSGIAFFIFTSLMIIGCRGPEPERGVVDSTSRRDTIVKSFPKADTGEPGERKVIPDMKKTSQLSDTLNCDTMLHKLVQNSNLDPGITKYSYNIWVDSSGEGIAILRVHLVEGHKEDPVIAWLKLDYHTRQLSDISFDTPKILTCDTTLFKKIIEHCPIK